MGAQVITHQPNVLQTALPAAADRALLRAMKASRARWAAACLQGLGAARACSAATAAAGASPEGAPHAIHTLQHITYAYSSICTVRGEAPPVLVHAMSNAGFIAYGE